VIRIGRVLIVILAGALLTGCGGQARPSAAQSSRDTGDGRLALVSGRDDHGFVATDQVPVYDKPGGTRQTGKIHDGTLVRVIERRNTSMHVLTLEGPHVTGWLDDFYLRGQLRLVGPPPRCRSRIGDTGVEGGTEVLVYDVRGAQVMVQSANSRLRGWAPLADLRELAPQGPNCAADPPGSPHHHHGP
jgi:hypothetical protein